MRAAEQKGACPMCQTDWRVAGKPEVELSPLERLARQADEAG